MKLAFSTLGCPDWDLGSIVGHARDNGYAGIEIRGIQRQLDLTRVPELTGAVEATRELLRSNGLAVACVSTSAKFSTADAAERGKHLRSAKEHMAIAASLGAPCIRVFGGTLPDGADGERCLGYLSESLQELGEHGRRLGVRVGLETHDSYSTGKQVAAVLEKTGHPLVGAVWDIYHPCRKGESPEDTIDFLEGKIFHVHIKDGDFGGQLTLLGEGRVPVVRILRLLKESGYTGYLSVEWEKAWQPELAPAEAVLPQYARTLREYLARIA